MIRKFFRMKFMRGTFGCVGLRARCRSLIFTRFVWLSHGQSYRIFFFYIIRCKKVSKENYFNGCTIIFSFSFRVWFWRRKKWKSKSQSPGKSLIHKQFYQYKGRFGFNLGLQICIYDGSRTYIYNSIYIGIRHSLSLMF